MLTEIVERTRSDLPALRSIEAEIRAAAERASAPRGFQRALAAEGLGVIAEVKRRSPSRGMIDADLDPVDISQAKLKAFPLLLRDITGVP